MRVQEGQILAQIEVIEYEASTSAPEQVRIRPADLGTGPRQRPEEIQACPL